MEDDIQKNTTDAISAFSTDVIIIDSDTNMEDVSTDADVASDILIAESDHVETLESDENIDTTIHEITKLTATIKNSGITMLYCEHCEKKTRRAAGCENKACKKCCREMDHKPCSLHPKIEQESDDISARRIIQRKPVLKHEFRENSFSYYNETVTLFCIQDFFRSKRLSQHILSDRSRSRRVNGSTSSIINHQLSMRISRKSKKVKSPQLKRLIQSAFVRT